MSTMSLTVFAALMAAMAASCHGRFQNAAPLIRSKFKVLSPNLVTTLSNGTVKFSKLQYSSSSAETYDRYLFGTFSFRLRLQKGFTAGIVSAVFLTSVSQQSTRKAVVTRDEIDLEFLGHTDSTKIVFSTNYYAQGKGQGIHEEGFRLWFDPADRFHVYTIRWTRNYIQWFVDGKPLRQAYRFKKGGLYPNKPMYLQISQWDASAWATEGGRIRSDYSKGPFTFDVAHMDLSSTCRWLKRRTTRCSRRYFYGGGLSAPARVRMYMYRRKFLLWSNVK